MIQSDKFDSLNMNIKKLANSFLIFTLNRLIEIFGIIISVFGLLLFFALISYSPHDQILYFLKTYRYTIFLDFTEVILQTYFFNQLELYRT